MKYNKLTSCVGFLVTCSCVFMRRLRLYSLSPTYLNTSSLGAYLTISDTQPSVTLKGHKTTVKSKMRARKGISVYLYRNFMEEKKNYPNHSFLSLTKWPM